jgi:diguanylate cyclase (GGDEF)-like protein
VHRRPMPLGAGASLVSMTSHAASVAHTVRAMQHPLARVWPFRLGGAYVVLAGVLIASAFSSLMFAAFPPNPETPRFFDLGTGVVCLLLAFAVLVLAPRSESSWGLDACIAITATLGAASTSLMPRAQGQLLVGFGFVLLAAYTAYYRPRRRLLLHLGWMLAVYAVALAVDPHLTSPLYFGVVAGTVAGLALLVSFMAEQLRAFAFRDSLTGLLNRRGFEVSAAPLLSLASRHGRPLTVGLIDLDGFKAYNDAYGHLAGDELLVEISSAWVGALRGADLLARFGGDEFVLLLPGSTPDDARDLEARLRQQHTAGWSVGFAQWREGTTIHDTLTNADAELYAEKRTRGRRSGAHAQHAPIVDLSADGGEQRGVVARNVGPR